MKSLTKACTWMKNQINKLLSVTLDSRLYSSRFVCYFKTCDNHMRWYNNFKNEFTPMIHDLNVQCDHKRIIDSIGIDNYCNRKGFCPQFEFNLPIWSYIHRALMFRTHQMTQLNVFHHGNSIVHHNAIGSVRSCVSVMKGNQVLSLVNHWTASTRDKWNN